MKLTEPLFVFILEPVSKICSGTLQEAPAYETAADFEERFVNVGQPFVSNSESAKPMQPSDGALHHPASLAQSATVLGSAPCDLGLDTQGEERRTMRVGIVSTVSLHQLGLSPRSTAFASNGRDGLNQRQQLGHVVAIGLGQNDRERNALRVDEEVMFRAGTTAIGWVRSSFFPAPRRGSRSCRPRHARSRCARLGEALRAALGAGASTPRLAASVSTVASRSPRSRSPSLAATSSKGCPSAARTRSRSALHGRTPAVGLDLFGFASCLGAAAAR